MARVNREQNPSIEINPNISYNVKLARQVLNAYADDGKLTADECTGLGLNEAVSKSLQNALNDDGILDAQERRDLYEKEGVSKKFIWMLAGTKEGSRPVKMRVRNLIEELEDGKYGALRGLREIGPYAKEAVPAVVDTLHYGLSLYFKQKKWEDAPAIVLVPPISIGYGIGKNIVDGQGNGEAIVQMATDALGAIGAGASEAVPDIMYTIHRVSDKELHLRLVKALGHIGANAKRAVSLLVDILCDEKTSREVRTAAAKALGQIGTHGNPRVIPALKLYAVMDLEETVRCESPYSRSICRDKRDFMETARDALRAIDGAERDKAFEASLKALGVTE